MLSTAENYHEATKYTEESLSQTAKQLDMSQQPSPFKEFVSSTRIRMAPYLPFSPTPFDQEGESLEKGDPASDLGKISRLLYFTNGITGVIQYPGAAHALRAAPSAGALYPTEIYLVCRNSEDLADGIYNYQIADHSLVLVCEGNHFSDLSAYSFNHPAVEASQFILLLTGIYQRSAWRYEQRAYRRILLDTGHVLGNITSYAAEEKLAAHPIYDFHDEAINQLLFLNDEEEVCQLLVALPPFDRAERLSLPPRRVIQPGPQDEEDAATMIALQKSGYFNEGNSQPATATAEAMEVKYPTAAVMTLEQPELVWSGIAQTIVRRRSTRKYSGDEIGANQLSLLLWHAYQPFRAALNPDAVPEVEPMHTNDWLCLPCDLETYVVVHNVTNVLAGIYHYEPGAHTLRTVRMGDFVRETWHICLGQELARDASAMIVHTADLPKAIERYGNRAYRSLHLDAGHLGERLNLAAVGVGLGVSGIGGFFDDEVNETLSLDRDYITVYITTIGQPA